MIHTCAQPSLRPILEDMSLTTGATEAICRAPSAATTYDRGGDEGGAEYIIECIIIELIKRIIECIECIYTYLHTYTHTYLLAAYSEVLEGRMPHTYIHTYKPPY
jgi:hypothetical protein